MAIIIDSNTKVMVQGLGREGSFQASKCKSYGTPIVSAVHLGRGRSYFEESIPVFDLFKRRLIEQVLILV